MKTAIRAVVIAALAFTAVGVPAATEVDLRPAVR